MPQQGLSDEAIEHETAVALPEREAMSLVDGVRLVPISPGVVPRPTEPVDPSAPVDTTGQGIDERAHE